MRDQRGHVSRIPRHDRERGDRSAAAGEHLDRPGPECPDDGVHVVGLGLRRVVDPPVPAGAAAEPARVVGDHGPLGEARGERGEAGGVHGMPDHEQRRGSVRGRQRPVNVVHEIRAVRPDRVSLHTRADRPRTGNSSAWQAAFSPGGGGHPGAGWTTAAPIRTHGVHTADGGRSLVVDAEVPDGAGECVRGLRGTSTPSRTAPCT